MTANVDESFNFTPINDMSSIASTSNTSLSSINIMYKPPTTKKSSPLKNISSISNIMNTNTKGLENSSSLPKEKKNSKIFNSEKLSNQPFKNENLEDDYDEEIPIYSKFDYNDTYSIIQEYEKEEPIVRSKSFKFDYDKYKENNDNVETEKPVKFNDFLYSETLSKNSRVTGSTGPHFRIYSDDEVSENTLKKKKKKTNAKKSRNLKTVTRHSQTNENPMPTLKPKRSFKEKFRKTEKLPRPTERLNSIDNILNTIDKNSSKILTSLVKANSIKSISRKKIDSILIPSESIPAPPSFKLTLEKVGSSSESTTLINHGSDGNGANIGEEPKLNFLGNTISSDQTLIPNHNSNKETNNQNSGEKTSNEKNQNNNSSTSNSNGTNGSGMNNGDENGDGNDDRNDKNNRAQRNTIISNNSTTQSTIDTVFIKSNNDNIVLRDPANMRKIGSSTIESLRRASMVASKTNASADTIATTDLTSNNLMNDTCEMPSDILTSSKLNINSFKSSFNSKPHIGEATGTDNANLSEESLNKTASSGNKSNFSEDYTSNVEVFNKVVYLKPNDTGVKLSKIERPISTTSSNYTNVPLTSPPQKAPPIYQTSLNSYNVNQPRTIKPTATPTAIKPKLSKPKLKLNTTATSLAFDKTFPYQNKRYSYNFRKNKPGRVNSQTNNYHYLSSNGSVSRAGRGSDSGENGPPTSATLNATEVGLGILVDYDKNDYFKAVPYVETVKGENPEVSTNKDKSEETLPSAVAPTESSSIVEFIEISQNMNPTNNSNTTSKSNSKNSSKVDLKNMRKQSDQISPRTTIREEFNFKERIPMSKPAPSATPNPSMTPYFNTYDLEKQPIYINDAGGRVSYPSSLDEKHHKGFFDTDLYYNYAQPHTFTLMMLIGLILPPIFLLLGLGLFDKTVGKFSRWQKLFSLFVGCFYFVAVYVSIGVGLGVGLRNH